jgi:hypothetical protein
LGRGDRGNTLTPLEAGLADADAVRAASEPRPTPATPKSNFLSVIKSISDKSPSIPRIFADFNNADSQKRIRLNCRSTFDDLAAQDIELKENMVVELYMEELRCDGVVHHSSEENIWVAEIDLEAIRRT